MTCFPVLLGLPIGILLGWISEWAPCLTVGGGGNVADDQPSDHLRDGPSWRRFTFRSLVRFGWHDVGLGLLTSGLMALLDLQLDPLWANWPVIVACLFFLMVAVVDIKHRLVLNGMIVPASALVLLSRLVSSVDVLALGLLGAVMGLFPFLLTALLKPSSLGGGDVKLAAFVGLALGFPQVLWALALGILSGGIVSSLLLLSQRWRPSDHIPYAPFICFGAITALLYDPVTPILLSMAG